MKAKLFILALAASACCMVANAQENATAEQSTVPARKVAFAADGGRWFIDAQWGAGMTLFGNNHAAFNDKAIKFTDRISYLNPSLALGVWHNPYFASRAKFMGWNLYDFTYDGRKPNKYENYYVTGQLDAMFDIVNFFAPYNPDRVFHIIPFAGIGVGYNCKRIDVDGNNKEIKEDRFTPTIDAGLMLKFKLSRVVDFNIEAQGTVNRFHFFGTNYAENKSDVNLFLSAGLTFNLGKTAFEPVVPMDYALVNDLNNQINTLRSENEELSKRPVSCPECPEVAKESVMVGNVVYFRINSAHIDANQMINIYNTAEYAKNNTETITLVGYADKDTGTAEYNMKLSERRAKAVADVLVNKYGISADRIKVEWKGSEEQPYSENVWNRIVLMNAEK